MLSTIMTKFEQKQQDHEYIESLYKWLHALFKFKAMDLVSDRSSTGQLSLLSRAVDERTKNFEKLIMLKGKLDLLLQLNAGEARKTDTEDVKYEAVKIIDENVEEEIEGVEILDVKDIKKTEELMQGEAEKQPEEEEAKSEEEEESLPDIAEMDEEEDENKIEGGIPKLSDSENMEDEEK